MNRIATVCLSLLLLTPAAPVLAQSAPCSDDAYRQFDFWVGTWQVHANGKIAGTNTIAKAHGNCVLHEQYDTGAGFTGSSFSLYDRGSGRWHQTWVDSSGLLLRLDGAFVDGKMVLQGQTLDGDGKPLQHKISWIPNADGSVQQLWQSRSGDGDWTTAFDGLYKRIDDTSAEGECSS